MLCLGIFRAPRVDKDVVVLAAELFLQEKDQSLLCGTTRAAENGAVL